MSTIHLRKRHAGNTSRGHQWPTDGAVLELPHEHAAELLAIPDGGFTALTDDEVLELHETAAREAAAAAAAEAEAAAREAEARQEDPAAEPAKEDTPEPAETPSAAPVDLTRPRRRRTAPKQE